MLAPPRAAKACVQAGERGSIAGMKRSQPPSTHTQFTNRFPKLGQAWSLANDAAASGPLHARTQRLVKLAVAVGAQRESAVHSAVRKARDAGVSAAELEQVVPLAASTIGFSASVAAWCWIRETLAAAPAASSPARRRRRAR
jgi:alkylhydroperoxidase/carboxymuconolactone decarboxylase family protein YurZ